MDEKIFGELPLRSWRWLGVNDVKSSAQVEEKFFDVPDGETVTLADVNSGAENVARRIKITVGTRGRGRLLFFADVYCRREPVLKILRVE